MSETQASIGSESRLAHVTGAALLPRGVGEGATPSATARAVIEQLERLFENVLVVGAPAPTGSSARSVPMEDDADDADLAALFVAASASATPHVLVWTPALHFVAEPLLIGLAGYPNCAAVLPRILERPQLYCARYRCADVCALRADGVHAGAPTEHAVLAALSPAWLDLSVLQRLDPDGLGAADPDSARIPN